MNKKLMEDSMKYCTDYLTCTFSRVHRPALSVVKVGGTLSRVHRHSI
jgi:hypothetical protein